MINKEILLKNDCLITWNISFNLWVHLWCLLFLITRWAMMMIKVVMFCFDSGKWRITETCDERKIMSSFIIYFTDFPSHHKVVKLLIRNLFFYFFFQSKGTAYFIDSRIQLKCWCLQSNDCLMICKCCESACLILWMFLWFPSLWWQTWNVVMKIEYSVSWTQESSYPSPNFRNKDLLL